jgi:hypothetical protein
VSPEPDCDSGVLEPEGAEPSEFPAFDAAA